MKRINPEMEIVENHLQKKWKRDLEFVVMLVLMLIVLLFAFLLIDSIGVRYVLYMILAVFSSIKVTEWLTDGKQ